MLKFLNRGSMKGEKATAGNSFIRGASAASYARLTMRLFQFVMGIVVIGLYATDLHNAHKVHKYTDHKWAYATFCGAASAIAAVTFMLPFVKAWLFFGVDALIWFFYVVAFGIFGKMYIKEDAEGDKGVVRMKHAAWIDMVNMILWFITACYGGFIFLKYRKARTTLTGRGEEHV
ncbi:hypothetical protein K491DRAFT_589250 [Lophiostoma macrostomum CBS 122681]|uniref:MARVEL domain-containing protein n=1 Tax=Lophiostoma macrostomum CBS 122681 TaxID=1314788 RepID=A0A6A6TM83_9PLEO|nr:hypothetical protein K491DRAFT_589250 [Lophiostoma macrostomum CBS 122681]